MKKFMITGGLIGSSIGLVSGLSQQCDWPTIIWRASVAAFIAGLLMRWWGRIWAKSFQEVCAQKIAAQNAENETTSVPLTAKP